MKIKEVVSYLEGIAPLQLQESYDNSGLIIGDLESEVKSILVTLDCTEDVVDECIKQGCNLIVAHHPVIFSAIKKINYDSYIGRTVIKAIKNNIAIYAFHTNLDNIIQGVNSKIADKLFLENRAVLSPKKDVLRQLVFYCPSKHVNKVTDELFQIGAGAIGFYDKCSFHVTGKGTFRPLEKSNPYIGDIGKIHIEKEERIELVFPSYLQSIVVDRLLDVHPYEQVAYQLYTLDNRYYEIGAGLIGELKYEVDASNFLRKLKKQMKTDIIRYTPIIKDKIKKVALCGGSGSHLLDLAKSHNADIFITADFKYHDFFMAEDKIIIADIGHYESEQFTKDLIYEFLTKKFSKFAILLSKVNTNPINYL